MATTTIETAYEVKQYDIHFSNHLCSFGIFTDRDSAIEAMNNGLEKLYPGYKEDVYENGINQWITDRFEFGIKISEITLNVFEEL